MSDASEQTVDEQTPGAGATPTTDADPEELDGHVVDPPEGGSPPARGGVPDGDGDVAEIEEDLDELVEVGAQRDEYLALAQRTQADFENYRKRVARESALAQERGVAKLAKELLPALDNLDRALGAAAQEEARRASGQGPAGGRRPSSSDRGPGGPAEDSSLQGVRLVREELTGALARVGVESFSPAGEPFDPAFHEAMAQQPIQGVPSGTVAEVYQPGYRLGEQIIRPARVVVAA
jgi:molecular chaperone GrpE